MGKRGSGRKNKMGSMEEVGGVKEEEKKKEEVRSTLRDAHTNHMRIWQVMSVCDIDLRSSSSSVRLPLPFPPLLPTTHTSSSFAQL